ncbi:hypothetical protein EDC04DRAFT_3098325 [Pisolithus marmoratus]|nr:hypothetical protein EDC04DRAFT_3098325 [Pisolithus marmoratus]
MNDRLLPGQYLITSLENNEHLGVSPFVNPVPDPPPAEVILLRPGVVPPQVIPILLRSYQSTSGEPTPMSLWSRTWPPVVEMIASLPLSMNLLRYGLSATEDLRTHTPSKGRKDLLHGLLHAKSLSTPVRFSSAP